VISSAICFFACNAAFSLPFGGIVSTRLWIGLFVEPEITRVELQSLGSELPTTGYGF
jgi:hypothetical protein